MKIKSFIISTAAKWFDIFVLLVFTVISVPIMLSKWNIETFGAWILLLGVMGYINTPILGIQEYIYGKNLKLGIKKKKIISTNITSSLPFTVLISVVLILCLTIDLNYQFIASTLNISETIKNEWTLAIFLYGIYSLFTYSVAPFFTHALSIFGYLPILTWVASIRIFFTQLVVVCAIYFYDTTLITTFIAMLITEIIFHLGEYVIFYFILKKEKIKYESVSLLRGFHDFLNSIWITVSNIIESISANGMRVIITALANPATLVIFTTIRTVTNMIMKALDTIRIPFLTEVMSNFSNNNSKKLNMNFELYYMFIIIIVFPVIIILQFFIEDLFNVWTLGNIEFNIEIYILLITTVLISSIGFPFRVVITGNNLVKKKFLITAIKNLLIITAIYFLFDTLKILSFGIALLIGELVELIFNYIIIDIFFKKKKFKYNKKIFNHALLSLLVSLLFFAFYRFNNIEIIDNILAIYVCVILYIVNVFLMINTIDKISLSLIKKIKI